MYVCIWRRETARERESEGESEKGREKKSERERKRAKEKIRTTSCCKALCARSDNGASAPEIRACDKKQTVSQGRHAATHCNTLQHTATHCNTLQHTQERASPRNQGKTSNKTRILSKEPPEISNVSGFGNEDLTEKQI